jgi:hypothetical protein
MTNQAIKSHVDRCIELYGQPINMMKDEVIAEHVDRSEHEQMRVDLMLAVGMLAALNPKVPE